MIVVILGLLVWMNCKQYPRQSHLRGKLERALMKAEHRFLRALLTRDFATFLSFTKSGPGKGPNTTHNKHVLKINTFSDRSLDKA